MDDRERYIAWLEIQEKYRILEEEWRSNRRGKNAKTNTKRTTTEKTAEATSGNIAGANVAPADYS